MANSEVSLQQMLALAKQGDEKAMTDLVQMYLPKADMLAHHLLHAEKDDLVQEALISLLSAIAAFNDTVGVTFETYAMVCMKNAMLAAQKKSLAKKRFGTKLSLSDLDEQALTSGDDFDPQQIVVQMETLDGLIKLADKALSKYERTVLGLYLQGYSYSDISSRLDKPEKSVDNALQRVRKKLKNAQSGE